VGEGGSTNIFDVRRALSQEDCRDVGGIKKSELLVVSKERGSWAVTRDGTCQFVQKGGRKEGKAVLTKDRTRGKRETTHKSYRGQTLS